MASGSPGSRMGPSTHKDAYPWTQHQAKDARAARPEVEAEAAARASSNRPRAAFLARRSRSEVASVKSPRNMIRKWPGWGGRSSRNRGRRP